MSKCQEIQNNLLEIVEQAVAERLPEEIAAHLQGCPDCAALVAEYRPLVTQMNVAEQPVPETLWRSVQAQVNALSQTRERGILRTVFGGNALALSFKSALLVIAAVAGVYLGSGLGGNQTSYAETLADDYATLLANHPAGSLASSYLQLNWDGSEEAGQ